MVSFAAVTGLVLVLCLTLSPRASALLPSSSVFSPVLSLSGSSRVLRLRGGLKLEDGTDLRWNKENTRREKNNALFSETYTFVNSNETKEELSGHAVTFDHARIGILPLWNREIRQDGFPRFQDSAVMNRTEFDRLCKAGYRMREWLSLLTSASANSSLVIDGTDRIPRNSNLVFCSNSHQSNFIAPYDFFVADGRVVRQRWATDERPFAQDGTRCWVFQLSGSNKPGIVSINVGQGDVVKGQRANVFIPQSDASGEPAEAEFRPETISVREGVSGLPIVWNRECVSHLTVRARDPSKPVEPNQVLWDPASTIAAFSAVGTLNGSTCLAFITTPLSVHRFADALVDLGMDQALLLGGSGDVCAWRRGPQEPGWDIESPHGWMLAAQPRKVSTRSGLRKGERPLNAVLAAFQVGG